MYTLIIKQADGNTARIGHKRCIYDYQSFDDLMEHAKEIDESGLMRRYGWELIISQQP